MFKNLKMDIKREHMETAEKIKINLKKRIKYKL